ncbi:hypothetical protein ACKVMT_14125 [Halobacteriales archaeon Cl-PHB]
MSSEASLEGTEPVAHANFRDIDLRAFARAIDCIADECRIHVGRSGLYVSTVDPANVGLVDIAMFGEVESDWTGAFGLNLSDLLDALDMLATNSTPGSYTFEFSAEGDRACLSRDSATAEFATIDPSSIHQPNTVDVDYDCQPLILSPRQVRKLFDVVPEGRDGNLGLRYYPEDCVLTSEFASDGIVYSVQTDVEQLETDESLGAMFSTDYLEDVAEGISEFSRITGTATVSLFIAEQKPVFIEAHSDSLWARWAVAPRIQTGDD